LDLARVRSDPRDEAKRSDEHAEARAGGPNRPVTESIVLNLQVSPSPLRCLWDSVVRECVTQDSEPGPRAETRSKMQRREPRALTSPYVFYCNREAYDVG